MEAAATTIQSATSKSQFQHQADYSRLSGQLEYSASTKSWKLRYIPLDGTTDDFGGSVSLSEASNLAGFEHGQFVTVYGGLGPKDGSSRTFSPLYNVQRIELQK